MAEAPITVDSPWGGTTYNPATPLDITTIESAIVAQLKAAIGNAVDVAHFPDKPEHYRMTHRVGAVLVVYGGSEYGDVELIDYVRPGADARIFGDGDDARPRLGVRRPAGRPDPGAYSILEAVRVALTGFQPNA